MNKDNIGHDKPLPYNDEMEKHVIGSLMSFQDQAEIKKYASMLTPYDFFNIHCIEIFKSIKKIISNNEEVNLIQIMDIYNNDFVLEIYSGFLTSANLDASIKGVKKYASMRASISMCNNFLSNIHNVDNPVGLIKKISDDLSQTAEYSSKVELKDNDASDVIMKLTAGGFSSGFIGHDFNDSGLKKGCLTLLVGFRGDGKTSLARQMLMASAMQGYPVFNFIGESSMQLEKSDYIKLFAEHGECEVSQNIGGRSIYTPTQVVEDRFNARFNGLIFLEDTNISKNRLNLFDVIMLKMDSLAKTKGVKLFLLDNMMILNQKSGKDVFSEQKRIVQTLKKFAVDNEVHICLIVHPAKGQTTTSGVAEQENLADTIIRYVRIKEDDKQMQLKIKMSGFPEHVKPTISAMLINEKVRDGGSQNMMYFSFDPTRGAIIEQSMLEKANEYQNIGFWVNAIPRYGNEDMPAQTIN